MIVAIIAGIVIGLIIGLLSDEKFVSYLLDGSIKKSKEKIGFKEFFERLDEKLLDRSSRRK